jgi:hypothetical protein
MCEMPAVHEIGLMSEKPVRNRTLAKQTTRKMTMSGVVEAGSLR